MSTQPTEETQTKKDIRILLDCFSGADGGVSFVKVRSFLEGLDASNSVNEANMLASLNQLARLITILSE